MAGLLFRIALVVTLAAPLVGVTLAPTVLIHETFDENDGGWTEESQPWIRAEITDGKLRLNTMVNRQHSVVRDVGLPATGDFDIEFTVETRGGSEEQPFGLVWGHTKRSDFFEYLIWMDGRFEIDRNGSLGTEQLTDTTPTPDLNTGAATNALKLSRRGQIVLYSINGKLQGELALTSAIGPGVGFVIWGEIDAYFDDLVVTRQ